MERPSTDGSHEQDRHALSVWGSRTRATARQERLPACVLPSKKERLCRGVAWAFKKRGTLESLSSRKLHRLHTSVMASEKDLIKNLRVKTGAVMRCDLTSAAG